MTQRNRSGLTRRTFAHGLAAGGLTWIAGHAEAADASTAPAGRKPPETPGSDWPTYRRDPALTALSPLKGGFARPPSAAWSLDLGGPQVASERIVVADVTGDGTDGFLALGDDRVVCRDATGRLLWKLEGYPSPAVVEIRDFAGDGSRGILLTTTLAGRVETFMVAGRTGKAVSLWRDENNFGGHLRIGKLLPGVPGAQVASTSSGTAPPEPWGGFVRLVSFAGGLDRPRFHIRRFVEGGLYAPLILFADLDADGAAEMVVISHEEIWTFDPATGAQKFNARYGPSIRTYVSTIAVVKLAPGDTHPSLVMINPMIPGLRAVRLDGKSRAETLWKVVVGPLEDQYQPAVKIAPGGADVAYDLNGDGRYHLAASVFNERGDGKQHLLLFDARTGSRLWEGPDARILSVDDLDGDGKPEAVLQEGPTLRIARWTGSGFTDLWRKEGVTPLVLPLPREGDLTRTAGGNALVCREKPGSPDFLLRFPEGVRSCRLTPAGVESTPSQPPDAPRSTLNAPRVTWDGKAVVTTRDGREIYRYVPPAPQTYLAPPPLAADLGGRRQILVRNAAGKYVLCSPDGKQMRVLIDRPYDRFLVHVDPAAAGPAICDVDGDGESEVVAAVTGSDGTPFCAILDAAGAVKRRLELAPGATILNRGPTGSLGPGRGRWILLRMAFGTDIKPGRGPLVAAYDGKTGEQLWVRDHYSFYGKNPVTFAAHVPTAVLDYDGDGADDWLVCSENFYGVIDVKNNRDLVEPVTLSDTVPGHWTAYTYPSVGDLQGKGRRVLFHHQSYSLVLVTDLQGKPLWHYGLTRDTGGAWGLLADVDGDGKQEVLNVQPDGVIRCFAPEPAGALCPRCPPGSTLSDVNHAGRPRWELDMKGPISRLIGADLDGDGRYEVLFGDRLGLHALGERAGKPHRLWSVPFDRRVGEPILADIDQDGRAEILVPVEDGRLYCLR